MEDRVRFEVGHDEIGSTADPDVVTAEAADGLGVLPDVADAVVWANDLIARIDAA